ncbi:uncharacterized protein LOC121740352 [Aricia agestis]|uniref:uncharacterized protein LOC121740352 n=1 Tax=Aricia agestis TaxID=91739 RepID=UPI001C207B3B|nr:uncharacterized protein LOC121740352 [Aricia agestis]
MAAALSLVLVVIQLLILCASSDEDIYSNGWRPIPRERVFGDYWNLQTPGFHAVNRDDFIQEVDAPKADLMMAGESGGVNQGVSIVLPVNRRHFESVYMKSDNNDITYRRGKKLEFAPTVLNIVSDKYENTNKIDKENNSTGYEVTENSTEEFAEQNTVTREHNYDAERGNNFTNNLLKILSNYKIRADDVLPNYALSLKQESPKSNGYVYMRLPYRYNSLNHAPVDPLLAVFLSNYGYYLPGLFGYQRNYKNLYGYSASNNIHNNKPFGAYKIFADTDSAL